MPRTSKKTEENKEVTKMEVTESVEIKKETEKPKTETVKKRSRAEKMRALKRDASKIDVEVMNLTNGSFIYENGYDSIRMENPGETTLVGLDLLLKMKNAPSMRKLFISIVDVYTNEYELEDILDILDLTKVYNGKELSLDVIDSFLNEISVEEFSKELDEMSPELANRVCQRAIFLATLNQFDSMGKRSIIETKFNNAYIFKSY